jgi:hypothetical protein
MASEDVVSSIYCNRCGDPNPRGSRFCESCGDPFDSPACACGAELVKKARYCHMCGASVLASPETRPTVSQPSL